MILENKTERVFLLKDGFIGKQIERLYIILNSVEIVDVNWLESR